MIKRVKYFLGALVSLPLLPVIYLQGKKVRKSVPALPEAKGTEGIVDAGSEKVVRVLTIGESTIAGVGVQSHKEGFTGLLAQKLSDLLNVNVQWRVYARSGYTAERVRIKILPKIQETTVDLLVIGLGGNDAFTLNRPWKWRRAIRELIEDLQNQFPDTPIAFTNMPPIKEFPAFTSSIKFVIGNLVELLGDELKAITQDYDQVYYNPETLILNDWIQKLGGNMEESDFFSDGVHPSKLTYQEWGKDFATFLVANKVVQIS